MIVLGDRLPDLMSDELRRTDTVYDIIVSGSHLYLVCGDKGMKCFTISY